MSNGISEQTGVKSASACSAPAWSAKPSRIFFFTISRARPARRQCVELEIRKIYTRNPKGKKWFGKNKALFTSRAEEVLDHPGVDIVIEALGFQSAAQLPQFRDYILRAFRNGKSVVTSDKAVLARYGKEIWAAAKKSRPAASLRSLRRRRHSGDSLAQRKFRRRRARSDFRHRQRHLQLYPVADGKKRQTLRRGAQRSATERLRRNQSGVPTSMAATPKPSCCCSVWSPSACRSSPARSGARESKIFKRSIFAMPDASATAPSNNSPWRGEEGRRFRFSFRPPWCRAKIFSASVDGATNAVCFAGKSSSAGRGERDCDYVLVGPGAGGGPTAVAVLGDVCELARGERKFSGAPSLIRAGDAEAASGR